MSSRELNLLSGGLLVITRCVWDKVTVYFFARSDGNVHFPLPSEVALCAARPFIAASDVVLYAEMGEAPNRQYVSISFEYSPDQSLQQSFRGPRPSTMGSPATPQKDVVRGRRQLPWGQRPFSRSFSTPLTLLSSSERYS